MDHTATLKLLIRVGCPIRIPTACWLISDVFNCIDYDARTSLAILKDKGLVTIDNGGWIKVAATGQQS